MVVTLLTGSRSLGHVSNYDASMQVIVRLDDPLRGVGGVSTAKTDLLSLCLYLDTLYRRQATRTNDPAVEETIEKIVEILQKLPDRPSFKSYLEKTGIATLCPRVAEKSGAVGDTTAMRFEDYLTHVGLLNQVTVLCNQLRNDAHTLTNHKYMAHQLALLYQSLGSAGAPLDQYKRHIEGQFDAIKQSTTNGNPPHLTREQIDWMDAIVANILATINSLPEPLINPFQPLIGAIQPDLLQQ
eukprot:Opistho-2@39697